ncbi:MAG: system killer suppression protein [Mesorhizobium sp.]|nr:MAG: system killer suppression protein [Mesorhizobium sp.]
MEFAYENNRLRRQLNSAVELQKAFGDKARRIQMRLEVLAAAECLADVPHDPPPRRHQLGGDWEGCFAVDINGNWRLIFRPDHDPVPLNDDGGVDLARVTAITFVGVVDYH